MIRPAWWKILKSEPLRGLQRKPKCLRSVVDDNRGKWVGAEAIVVGLTSARGGIPADSDVGEVCPSKTLRR